MNGIGCQDLGPAAKNVASGCMKIDCNPLILGVFNMQLGISDFMTPSDTFLTNMPPTAIFLTTIAPGATFLTNS